MIERDKGSTTQVGARELRSILLEQNNLHSLTPAAEQQVKNVIDRYKSLKKKKIKPTNVIDWNNIRSEFKDETIYVSVEESQQQERINTNSAKKIRRSLDNLERKQMKERTNSIYEQIVKKAADEGIEVDILLTLLLTRSSSKRVRQLGKQVLKGGDESNNTMEVQTATAVYADLKLGRQTYTQTKRIFKAAGFPFLPSWAKIRKFQAEVEIMAKPECGVYFSFKEACTTTLLRLKEQFQDAITNTEEPHIMDIKYGFDGSGSHSMFHQVNNTETNNMILTMFSPLKLSDSTGQIIWEQQFPNAAHSQRVLMIQKGKETIQNVQTQGIFNADIKEVSEGVSVELSEGPPVKVKFQIVSHMMDRKASDSYLGITGAYCDLCTYSKQQCRNQELVNEHFHITRNIDDMQKIFQDLQQDGSIPSRANDYSVRQGQKHQPVQEHKNVISCQVFLFLFINPESYYPQDILLSLIHI